MKRKFIKQLMLVFVVCLGIGTGFGIHFIKESAVPEAPVDSVDIFNNDDNSNITVPDQNTEIDNNKNDESKPDDSNSGSEIELPNIPTEKPDDEMTEKPGEEFNFSKFYIELDNEIIELKDFFEAMLFMRVESFSVKDGGNVSYTLLFDETDLANLCYDFEMIKECFNEAIKNQTLTTTGEQYIMSYKFDEETLELKIEYEIIL